MMSGTILKTKTATLIKILMTMLVIAKKLMLITLMTLVLMLVTKISPGTPPSFSHGRRDSIAVSR